MSEAHLFAIGVLLAWLAGIRVYLTVFGIGVAGFFGWLDLPQALQVTQSPWVIGVSGVLALAEFFADKIPGVDSGWDLLHTLLRVPAGAFLAALSMSPDGHLGAGMLATGAGVALTSHLLKSGTRASGCTGKMLKCPAGVVTSLPVTGVKYCAIPIRRAVSE